MNIILNDRETRVLGCLMEKSMATPDYYPLSLNALTNACNQKSNRDPVVDWDSFIVEDALAELEEKGWIRQSTVGRVPKFEETFTRQQNMVATEAAVICVLLLRGPQTPGAIRSRTERLATFENLPAVLETLERLREWGFVCALERQPGHKEPRFMHCFTDINEESEDHGEKAPLVSQPTETDRLDRLEEEIQSLQMELAGLKMAFEAFRKQFD